MKKLERLYYPNPQTIASAAYGLIRDDAEPWEPESAEVPEVVQFKGPF